MANIEYSSKNNSCANANDGAIFINQINFDNSNATSFNLYTIQWSGVSLSPSQISTDSRSLRNLSSGLYSFIIESLKDSTTVGPYEIEISAPPPLIINNVSYSPNNCYTNNGVVDVSVSGGVPPYLLSLGIESISTSDNQVSISGINPGSYEVIATDSNGCSTKWPTPIVITNSSISSKIIDTIPPTILDGYGTVKLVISGEGPFNLVFTNQDTQDSIIIDYSSTEYITNISNNRYSYSIDDKITPGTYSLLITNQHNCTTSSSFILPNIKPLIVNCSISKLPQDIQYSQHLTKPIFDTILIPFNHITNNTPLWNFIKTLQVKDNITLKIDNNLIQQSIVRNMLDKYLLDDNQIEILRLGDTSDSWFYYFYIAPSINISDNPNLLTSSYKLINTSSNDEYDLTLGLVNGEIDSTNASLIRGSFILDGVGYNQFANGENSSTYISNGLTNSFYEYDYIIYGVSKSTMKTIYTPGYVTTINFLDQYNALNIYVNTNDSSCILSTSDGAYVANVENILKYINDFNNITTIYIYNINQIPSLGKLNINPAGNNFLVGEGGQVIENSYDISYYYFDENSNGLETVYQNNEQYNGYLLNNVNKNYVIVKIHDSFDNKPKIIKYSDFSINYDDHYLASQNLIQQVNNNILSLFNYGDILLTLNNQNINANIPQPIDFIVEPTPSPEPENIVEVTEETTDTSTLVVNLLQMIPCFIYGPKKYEYLMESTTTFKNMIPGVYIIKGKQSDLDQHYLYQQEYRILIDKNTTNSINIGFVSYKNKFFIRNS